MKIVVAIKQVPARDSQLRIASGAKWIEDADLSYEINEPDAYALEAGLQLKEKHGGEVVALCAGPSRAAQTIREALAKGADRAIHIEDEGLAALDPLADGADAPRPTGRRAVSPHKPFVSNAFGSTPVASSASCPSECRAPFGRCENGRARTNPSDAPGRRL